MAAATLGDHHVTCQNLTVALGDPTTFRAGGMVAATITCDVSLADVAIPGLPGQRRVWGRSVEVIDTYRGDTQPAPSLDFAVYLSFFPHLVAGPIVRARELLPQLNEQPDPRRIAAPLAFRLIFGGLFKKVVISSFVSSAIVEPVFANPSQHTNLEILFGI